MEQTINIENKYLNESQTIGEITDSIKNCLKNEKFPSKFIDELTEIIMYTTHQGYIKTMAPKLALTIAKYIHSQK